MFVIHPRRPRGPRIDRDFVLMLHEWRVNVGAKRPDPNEMTDFNVLTFNGKAFPGTEPLVVKKGQRVRIRIGNLSAMDHHPIHLHGYQFRYADPGWYEAPGGTLAGAAAPGDLSRGGIDVSAPPAARADARVRRG